MLAHLHVTKGLCNTWGSGWSWLCLYICIFEGRCFCPCVLLAMDEVLTLAFGAYHQEPCLHGTLPPDDQEELWRILVQLCANDNSLEQKELELRKLQALADREETHAQALLASVFYRHRISKRMVSDEEAASQVHHYAKMASNSSSLGLTLLGYVYLDGLSVEKDAHRAVEILREAVEKGNPAAKSSLSYCLERGIGTKHDRAQSLCLLLSCVQCSALFSNRALLSWRPCFVNDQTFQVARIGRAGLCSSSL